MKLRKMEIENFRAFPGTRQISFEDPLGRIQPVSVLAGPNGCGKTSLLFGIVQTLRLVMGYRTPDVPEPSDADVNLSLQSSRMPAETPLAEVGPSARVELTLEFSNDELGAISQVLRSSEEPRYAKRVQEMCARGHACRVIVEWVYPPPPRRDGTASHPNWVRRVEPHDAVYALKGRRLAIRLWRDDGLTDRTLLDRIGEVFFLPQDRLARPYILGEPLDGGQHDSLVGVEGDEADTEEEEKASGRRERESGRPPVSNVLHLLHNYARERKPPPELDWQVRVKKTFNLICQPREYVGYGYDVPRGDVRGAPYFADKPGGTPYPLHVASGGEQVMIEYATRLTWPYPKSRSLILIDEAETHLHPAWIRQLYRALPQIGQDNQYILSTHSLELRRLAAEDGCLLDMGQMD